MTNIKLWISRILIGLVLLDNLQAAILFLNKPGTFAAAFDLAGSAAIIAIRSIGILFLMWCVPYFFATLNPVRYRVSLIEACIMQSIGLVGESILYLRLPAGLENTPSSLERFILFDAVGLIMLLVALIFSNQIRSAKLADTPRI